MKEARIQKIGKWLCIIGVAVLILSILIVFVDGSSFTPKLILISIIINTIGITLLRYKEVPKE